MTPIAAQKGVRILSHLIKTPLIAAYFLYFGLKILTLAYRVKILQGRVSKILTLAIAECPI